MRWPRWGGVASTINIRQGATWRGVFSWTDKDTGDPISLDGYSGAFALYRKAGAEPELAITSATGAVVIDAGAGQVTVRLGADVTGALTKPGFYELNVIDLSDPTEVEALAAGQFNLLLRGAPSDA